MMSRPDISCASCYKTVDFSCSVTPSFCHLPYKPIHHLIAFFINFRKMLPYGLQCAACYRFNPSCTLPVHYRDPRRPCINFLAAAAARHAVLPAAVLPDKWLFDFCISQKPILFRMPVSIAKYFVFTVTAELLQIKAGNINPFVFTCL